MSSEGGMLQAPYVSILRSTDSDFASQVLLLILKGLTKEDTVNKTVQMC